MRKSKIAEPMTHDAVHYRRDYLQKIMTLKDIKVFRIASLFGQTNSATAKKWVEGGDIYLNNLLKIINNYDFDLLSFFTYKGHVFKTTLDQLARAEESGIEISSLLGEVGEQTRLPDEQEGGPDIETLKYLCSNQRELIDAQKEFIAVQRSYIASLKDLLRDQTKVE